MHPAHTNKQHAFLMAGIGFAFLAAMLGWQMGQPGVTLRELGKTVKTPAPSRSQSATVGIDPANQVLNVSAEPVAAAPSATPQPLAPQPSVPPLARATLELVTEVDPTAPGNFLTAAGQQISVQQLITGGAAGGTQLGVIITPLQEHAAATADAQGAPAEVQSQARLLRSGFTYEEQLFRSKWGWAAYDALRRSAAWSSPQ